MEIANAYGYAKVVVFFHSANINRNNITTFAIEKKIAIKNDFSRPSNGRVWHASFV